jgi:prophage regulatory protein
MAADVVFLRLQQVMERTGLRRTALLGRVARGLFPRPISLGTPGSKRPSLAWVDSEVAEWQGEQIRRRDIETRPPPRPRARDANNARFIKSPDQHPEIE